MLSNLHTKIAPPRHRAYAHENKCGSLHPVSSSHTPPSLSPPRRQRHPRLGRRHRWVRRLHRRVRWRHRLRWWRMRRSHRLQWWRQSISVSAHRGEAGSVTGDRGDNGGDDDEHGVDFLLGFKVGFWFFFWFFIFPYRRHTKIAIFAWGCITRTKKSDFYRHLVPDGWKLRTRKLIPPARKNLYCSSDCTLYH